MKRRTFVKTSITAAASAAMVPNLISTERESSKKPNLLIIQCDELNFRTIGSYRDTLSDEQAFMWGKKMVVDTPHIDSLAAEGTLCTKFYAATPVCSPSRSSFISGRFPQNTGVPINDLPIEDSIVTFAHLLGDAGYATGYAGKWHLDGDGKPQWDPQRNFGFEDNRYMFNRGHWKQFEDTENGPQVKARDEKGKPTYSVEGADEESFATDWLSNKAIDFIEEHKSEPFCYMLAIPDPHGPDTVRAPYDTMLDDSDSEMPRTFDKSAKDVPSWAEPADKCNYKMAAYLGMMKCIDDNVGRILGALRERSLIDDTIVIFTADHGDLRGEHHRQNKGVPLEASAKVPFIIRYPKKIAASRRIDNVLNTVDFQPTILSMMGIKTSGNEEGRDASQILTTGKVPKGWSDVTFMRSTGVIGATNGWVAAVTPRHKLILSDKDEPWLLDLDEDPDELTNFVHDEKQRATARDLAKEIEAYGKRHNDPYTTNAKTRKALEKLAG